MTKKFPRKGKGKRPLKKESSCTDEESRWLVVTKPDFNRSFKGGRLCLKPEILKSRFLYPKKSTSLSL